MEAAAQLQMVVKMQCAGRAFVCRGQRRACTHVPCITNSPLHRAFRTAGARLPLLFVRGHPLGFCFLGNPNLGSRGFTPTRTARPQRASALTCSVDERIPMGIHATQHRSAQPSHGCTGCVRQCCFVRVPNMAHSRCDCVDRCRELICLSNRGVIHPNTRTKPVRECAESRILTHVAPRRLTSRVDCTVPSRA